MKPIIIEGPDGIGKSTAIKRLQFMIHNRGGLTSPRPVIDHFTRERVLHLRNEDEALGFFLGHLDHCVPPDPPRIFDRFHLGSWCYGFRNRLHETWIRDGRTFDRFAREIMDHAFVVVLYEQGNGNYERRMTDLLKVQPRQELFSIQQCVDVNAAYLELDPGLAHIYHDVGYIGHPDDCHLEYWIEEATKL